MMRLIKFLLGLSIGAAAGVLLAPKSGRELRQQLLGGAAGKLLPPVAEHYPLPENVSEFEHPSTHEEAAPGASTAVAVEEEPSETAAPGVAGAAEAGQEPESAGFAGETAETAGEGPAPAADVVKFAESLIVAEALVEAVEAPASESPEEMEAEASASAVDTMPPASPEGIGEESPVASAVEDAPSAPMAEASAAPLTPGPQIRSWRRKTAAEPVEEPGAEAVAPEEPPVIQGSSPAIAVEPGIVTEPEALPESEIIAETDLPITSEMAPDSTEPVEPEELAVVSEEEDVFPETQGVAEAGFVEEAPTAPEPESAVAVQADEDLFTRIEATRAAIEADLSEPFAPAAEPVIAPEGEELPDQMPALHEPAAQDTGVVEAEAEEVESVIQEASDHPAAPPVGWIRQGNGLVAAIVPPPHVESEAEGTTLPAAEPVPPSLSVPEAVVEPAPFVPEPAVEPAPAAPEPVVEQPAAREPGAVDQAEMRRRIEETRARLKAKAFDAMMSGESALLRNDSGNRPVPRTPETNLEPEISSTIDESLSQEDL